MNPKTRSLIAYIFGFILLSAFLYLTVLRHPGYIFFWDMSGSFDFNAPFDQYFYLFTPWDQFNVGIKNRLPIVSLIFIIFKPLQALFGLPNEAVIKLAVTILILGAYTAFYILFPRWFTLLNRKHTPDTTTIRFTIFRLIFSLLYLLIPFYAYRLPQLHLFYMSIFYPIHIYLFIRLITEKTVNPKIIALFVISMFFGLTSPHIIVIELMTFIPILVFTLIRNLTNSHQLLTSAKSLLIAGVGAILTNLYWVIPYVLLGSPDPGYVINTPMIGLLTQETSLSNFLIGQSEWFTKQADLIVIDRANIGLYPIQILGLATMYGFALIYLVKDMKRHLAVAVTITLAVTMYIIVSSMPFQNVVFDSIVYSPLGWIVREVNKLYSIWAFWTFLLFALGFVNLFSSMKPTDLVNKVLVYLILPISLLTYLYYTTPINVKFWKYLKPVTIDSSIEEVFELFDNDPQFFYVFYHPTTEPYRIPWKEKRFDIADSVDFGFLPYNSPKPPAYSSSVVPHSKTYTSLLTEYLLQRKDYLKEIAPYLSRFGIKYVVVQKTVVPIRLDSSASQQYIMNPIIHYLENNGYFTTVLSNKHYTVYENKSFNSGITFFQKKIYSTDSFSILEHLDPEDLNNTDLVFCNFPEHHDECQNTDEDKTFVVFDDNPYFFLDLLPDTEGQTYGISPYTYTHDYGINIGWGRASYYDRINGELHNVFRNYGINAWNFEISDEVVYSDKPFHENTSSSLQFSHETACTENCNLYALILYNHLGGELSIQIDNQEYHFNTLDDFEVYRWVQLDQNVDFINSDITVTLTNTSGIQSVGKILILPSNLDYKLRSEVLENSTVLKISTEDVARLPIAEPDTCAITTERYTKSFIPYIALSGVCDSDTSLKIKAFDSNFISYERSSNSFSDLTYYNVNNGRFSITLLLITYYDLLLWALFIVTLSLTGVFGAISLNKHTKKDKSR